MQILDPRWFDDNPMCQGCSVQRAAHTHHKVFKGMGGRKGMAKVKSEEKTNKIRLCLVCHEATHTIRASLNGFSCENCPQLARCYYGARLLKRPYFHLTPNW